MWRYSTTQCLKLLKSKVKFIKSLDGNDNEVAGYIMYIMSAIGPHILLESSADVECTCISEEFKGTLIRLPAQFFCLGITEVSFACQAGV